jgi:hypothetical protein
VEGCELGLMCTQTETEMLWTYVHTVLFNLVIYINIYFYISNSPNAEDSVSRRGGCVACAASHGTSRTLPLQWTQLPGHTRVLPGCRPDNAD